MDKKRIGELVISEFLFNTDNDVLWDIIIQSLPCGYHTESGHNVLDGEFKSQFLMELKNEY